MGEKLWMRDKVYHKPRENWYKVFFYWSTAPKKSQICSVTIKECARNAKKLEVIFITCGGLAKTQASFGKKSIRKYKKY